MSDVTKRGGWLVCAGLLACSGARPDEAATPAAPREARVAHPEPAGDVAGPDTAAPSVAAEPALSQALPTECNSVGELCLPPRAFVKRLCQDAYTGAAMVLLAKASPFSRGYVRSREVKAVNTLGGPTSDANLFFGEEVLILTRSGAPGAGEMQVSGMGGYDVLRWDGTCASLSDGELATRAVGVRRYAPFTWNDIDTNIQEALLEDQAIVAARKNQRKECHGVSFGRRSASCVDADAKLSERIVLAVRKSVDLPTPDRVP